MLSLASNYSWHVLYSNCAQKTPCRQGLSKDYHARHMTKMVRGVIGREWKTTAHEGGFVSHWAESYQKRLAPRRIAKPITIRHNRHTCLRYLTSWRPYTQNIIINLSISPLFFLHPNLSNLTEQLYLSWYNKNYIYIYNLTFHSLIWLSFFKSSKLFPIKTLSPFQSGYKF